jgi:type II secretory pathway pseudopilin PulG
MGNTTTTKDVRAASSNRPTGFTLVEAVIALFILSLAVAIAAPRLARIHRTSALRSVTASVTTKMWKARSEALTSGQATALVFERNPDHSWLCSIVQDGDGDGVRRSDVAAGIDLKIGRVLEIEAGRAGFGILRGVTVPNPNGSGALGGDLEDPIRAGSGDILTFTPDGTASSATLYLTDQHATMRAIRVFGVTGRMRTLAWEVGWPKWRIVGR